MEFKNVSTMGSKISIGNMNVEVSDSYFLMTDITVYGDQNQTINVKNSIFNKSYINIYSMKTCHIELCTFETSHVWHELYKPRYMVNMSGSDFLYITKSTFADPFPILPRNLENKLPYKTDFGLWMKNIRKAVITNSLFEHIAARTSQWGQVIYLSDLNVTFAQCTWSFNVASYGPICADNYVLLTNKNCSYISNTGVYGGVFLVSHSRVENIDCTFKRNIGWFRGAIVYAKKSYIRNYSCRFLSNFSNRTGSVIYAVQDSIVENHEVI